MTTILSPHVGLTSVAAALAADGIETSSLLEYAPAAILRAGGGAPDIDAALLEELRLLAVELHRHSGSMDWAFCEAMPAIASSCEGNPDSFRDALRLLRELVRVMGERAIDSLLMLQRGPTAIAEARLGSALAMREGLALGATLAARGIDPTETMRLGVRCADLAAGVDERHFMIALDALRSFIDELDVLGIAPAMPIWIGILAVAASHPGDVPAFTAALEELAELARSLHAHGLSAYEVFEYGVAEAYAAVSDRPELRSEILPMAMALIEHAYDPSILILLRSGFPSAALLDRERADPAIALTRETIDEGVDAGWFLGYSALPLSRTIDEDSDFFAALLQIRELFHSLRDGGFSPQHTFCWGLPSALNAGPLGTPELSALLDLGTELAAAGIDPGPTLEQGFGPMRAALPTPAIPAALSAARGQLALGLPIKSSMSLAIPALHRTAGGDIAVFQALLAEYAAFAASLRDLGVDTEVLLGSSLTRLAMGTGDDPTLLGAFLTNLRGLVAELTRSGINADASVGAGLSRVAEAAKDAPWVVAPALRWGLALAKVGVDPASVLIEVVPPTIACATGRVEVFDRIGNAVIALLARSHERGLSTGDDLAGAIGAAINACGESAECAEEALAYALRLASDGINAASPLHAAVSLAATWDADSGGVIEGAAYAALLARTYAFVQRAHHGAVPLDTACRECMYSLARVARGSPESLDVLLEALLACLHAILPDSGDRNLRPLVVSAAAVAGVRPRVFASSLTSLTARVMKAQRDGAETTGPFWQAMQNAAFAAAGNEPSFLALVDILLDLATGSPTIRTSLMAYAVPFAWTLGSQDAHAFRACLNDILRLRADLGERLNDALSELVHLHDLVRQQPSVWSDLIVPTLRAQGPGARLVLGCYRRLENAIDSPDAVTLLRYIATQEGVRAGDTISNLLVPGVSNGAIRDLGAEKEIILQFLHDVPFRDPHYYGAYRTIIQDGSLDAAGRRAQIDALRGDLVRLSATVVAGDVAEADELNPLFAQTLTYVFPPAVSVSSQTYLHQYHSFDDRDAHVSIRGELTSFSWSLPRGAYQIREGERIDMQPWDAVREAVRDAGATEEEIGALGRDLFEAWLGGRLNQLRTELLRRIYGVHRRTRAHLPDDLADAADLIFYREFLADSAKEIIQDALRAHRVADPARYELQARAKLASPARIGKGLVRAVRDTVADAADGLPREEAIARLRRQLAAFSCTEERFQRLLFAGIDGVADWLAELEPTTIAVELGDEHLRVLGELYGNDLAAMQRELFGDSGGRGKLIYRRSAGGPSMDVRIVVSKRKAHAVIGFCEGVCTATDRELWNDPRFSQAIIWGPDGRAWGGVHMLVVAHFGQEHLALPGINPSLGLITEAGEDAVLDAVLAWARGVARSWGLASVWVPTSRSISSNRGPIREVLAARNFPTLAIPQTRFSSSPYEYSFREVLVVG